MRLLAIDPGLKGGVALFLDGCVSSQDMPTYKLRTPGRKTRHMVDIETLRLLITANSIERIVVETPVAMPGQSSTSTATTFTNFGLLLALRLYAPVTEVLPAEWKKALKLGPDKKQAIAMARSLVPTNGTLKDGEAEAILIGHYWITAGEAHARARAVEASDLADRRKKRALAKAARTRKANRQPSRPQKPSGKPARQRASSTG